MEITRPAIETTFGMQAWVDRRRDEFARTSTGIRVVGTVGWTLMLLGVLTRVG